MAFNDVDWRRGMASSSDEATKEVCSAARRVHAPAGCDGVGGRVSARSAGRRVEGDIERRGERPRDHVPPRRLPLTRLRPMDDDDSWQHVLRKTWADGTFAPPPAHRLPPPLEALREAGRRLGGERPTAGEKGEGAAPLPDFRP